MNQSTGPKTPAGKSKSAQNAVKHGLLAGKWLPPEEKATRDALVGELNAEYQPSTATEALMIERIALAMTKLRRLHVMEDALHVAARVQASKAKDAGEAQYRFVPAELVEDSAVPPLEVWSLVARYQTSLNRQISKTIGELMLLKGRLAISGKSQTLLSHDSKESR